jgi:hypothetical protein
MNTTCHECGGSLILAESMRPGSIDIRPGRKLHLEYVCTECDEVNELVYTVPLLTSNHASYVADTLRNLYAPNGAFVEYDDANPLTAQWPAPYGPPHLVAAIKGAEARTLKGMVSLGLVRLGSQRMVTLTPIGFAALWGHFGEYVRIERTDRGS